MKKQLIIMCLALFCSANYAQIGVLTSPDRMSIGLFYKSKRIYVDCDYGTHILKGSVGYIFNPGFLKDETKQISLIPFIAYNQELETIEGLFKISAGINLSSKINRLTWLLGYDFVNKSSHFGLSYKFGHEND